MTGYSAVGLATDLPISEYCLERGIPLLDFPIAERERHYSSGRGAHFPTIPASSLYSLVEEAGLPETEFKGMPLFLWGSSRYHHITHGLLRKVIDPGHESYSILMIDNHNDCADSREESLPEGGIEYLLDCGTHLKDSVRSKALRTHCRTAMWVDARERFRANCLSRADLSDCGWHDLARPLENELYPLRFPSLRWLFGGRRKPVPHEVIRLLPEHCDQDMYVSVDIDALSREFVNIDSHEVYKQGKMELDDMLELLDATFEKRHVIGMDINGMTPDPRSRQVYDSILLVVRRYLS